MFRSFARKFSTNINTEEFTSHIKKSAIAPFIATGLGVCGFLIATHREVGIHDTQIKHFEMSLGMLRDDTKDGFQRVSEDFKRVDENFKRVDNEIKYIRDDIRDLKKDTNQINISLEKLLAKK